MTVPSITTRRAHRERQRPVAPRAGLRTDIQGLRALAVLLVVAFHLWPGRLAGGFIGVDVFFVISGFLITGHIVRSARHDRSVLTTLSSFYARRIRRLMPAATAVLLITAAAVVVWMPVSRWNDMARELLASALAVENWVLAGNAVDYLAAESAPSPFQHFWSLSVEEQFYLFWPVLLLSLLALLRRRRNAERRAAVIALVAGVGVLSFAAMLWLMSTAPAAAYFVTPGRVWQLAAGGLLALVVSDDRAIPRPVRFAAPWVGLAVILVAALTLGDVTYPGVWALLPVIGATLVLLGGGEEGRGSLGSLARVRPLQIVGDASYSIYLWHWPLVILVPYAIGHELRGVEKVILFAASLLLGWLSLRWVETPLRTGGGRRRVAYALGLACILSVGAAALGTSLAGTARVEQAQQAVDARLVSAAPCAGARSTSNPDCSPAWGEVPGDAGAAAAEDRPWPWEEDCANGLGAFATTVCRSDSPDGDLNVLLWGDSHSGNWSDALRAAGEAGGFDVTVAMRHGCPSTGEAPDATVSREIPAAEQAACDARNAWVEKTLVPEADVVILANMTSNYPFDGDAAGPYEETIETLLARGEPVVVLEDVPLTGDSVGNRVDGPECLSSGGECRNPRERALYRSVTDELETRFGDRITVADPADNFCDERYCYFAVGGLPVYFDASHLTGSFSESLDSWIYRVVSDAVTP